MPCALQASTLKGTDTMRLFAAVNFDKATVDKLYSCCQLIRENSISVNVSRRENLHLTLAFIGEVPSAKRAIDALQRVSAPPFELTIQGYGEFGKGSVCFAKIQKCDELSALAQKVRESLVSLGVNIDTKPFKPHITLARHFESFPDFDKKELAKALGTQTVRVTSFSLMKSERINGKLTYTEVYKKPLE